MGSEEIRERERVRERERRRELEAFEGQMTYVMIIQMYRWRAGGDESSRYQKFRG